jgi:hypothetical protein
MSNNWDYSCHEPGMNVISFMSTHYGPQSGDSKELLLMKAMRAFRCIRGRSERMFINKYNPAKPSKVDPMRSSHLFPIAASYVFGMYSLKNALYGLNESTKSSLLNLYTNVIDVRIIRDHNLATNLVSEDNIYGQYNFINGKPFSIETYIKNSPILNKLYENSKPFLAKTPLIKKTYFIEHFNIGLPINSKISWAAESAGGSGVAVASGASGAAGSRTKSKKSKPSLFEKFEKIKKDAIEEEKTLEEAQKKSENNSRDIELKKQSIRNYVYGLSSDKLKDLMYRISVNDDVDNELYFESILQNIYDNNLKIYDFMIIFACNNYNKYKKFIPQIINFIRGVGDAAGGAGAAAGGAGAAAGGAGDKVVYNILFGGDSKVSFDLFNVYKTFFDQNDKFTNIFDKLNNVKATLSTSHTVDTYDIRPSFLYAFYGDLNEITTISFKEYINQIHIYKRLDNVKDFDAICMAFLIIGIKFPKDGDENRTFSLQTVRAFLEGVNPFYIEYVKTLRKENAERVMKLSKDCTVINDAEAEAKTKAAAGGVNTRHTISGGARTRRIHNKRRANRRHITRKN